MGIWGLAATIVGEPLARFIGGTRDRVATGISLGHPGLARRAGRRRPALALAAGYRKVKIKIEPGRDVEFVRAAREALGPDAQLMADANNAYTLADADRLAGARRARPDDDRAAAGARRPRAPRRAAAAAAGRRSASTSRSPSLDRAQDMVDARQRPDHQHQAGPRRRLRRRVAIHDFCREHGDSRVVRRHARERRRARVQRGARVAAELHAAGRREPERALLGARHRHAGVDDGATEWCTCRSTGRGSASTSTWSASSRSRCARTELRA